MEQERPQELGRLLLAFVVITVAAGLSGFVFSDHEVRLSSIKLPTLHYHHQHLPRADMSTSASTRRYTTASLLPPSDPTFPGLNPYLQLGERLVRRMTFMSPPCRRTPMPPPLVRAWGPLHVTVKQQQHVSCLLLGADEGRVHMCVHHASPACSQKVMALPHLQARAHLMLQDTERRKYPGSFSMGTNISMPCSLVGSRYGSGNASLNVRADLRLRLMLVLIFNVDRSRANISSLVKHIRYLRLKIINPRRYVPVRQLKGAPAVLSECNKKDPRCLWHGYLSLSAWRPRWRHHPCLLQQKCMICFHRNSSIHEITRLYLSHWYDFL